MMSIGLVAWRIVRVRWPQTGTVPPSAPSADPSPARPVSPG
jgi:hypothetical protein